jgi:DNA-binding NtrC family response regulator
VLATNLDLEKAVREGRFREDLYYRINVVSVEMPALRDRRSDIPNLAEHFLHRFNREHGKRVAGFSDAAMLAMQQWPWPGNVRQLENVIERAVVLSPGERVELSDLPPAMSTATPPSEAAMALVATGPLLPLKEALAGPERLILERALQLCGGNREHAAKALDINRSTLFAKLRKYGIR